MTTPNGQDTPNAQDRGTRPSFGMPGRPAGTGPVAGRGQPSGPPPGNSMLNGPAADLPPDSTVDLLEARQHSGVDAVLDAFEAADADRPLTVSLRCRRPRVVT